MVRECHLNLLPSRVGVRALLALLVESGALYCIVWVREPLYSPLTAVEATTVPLHLEPPGPQAFVVAFEAAVSMGSIDIHAASDLEKHAAYTTFCTYLMSGALVPLIVSCCFPSLFQVC